MTIQVQNLANWMETIASALADRKITDVVLPGTHDSGTYAITASSGVSPDAASFMKTLDFFAGGTIAKFARAQDLTLLQQLQAGARYLDLRVAYDGTDLRFCHTLWSAKVEEGLQDVATFLAQNRKEIIILDFQHIYFSDDATHELLMNMIQQYVGSRLIPPQQISATLQEIWEGQQQVIVLYRDAHGAEHPQFWAGSSIDSQWANTSDITVLKNFLTNQINNRAQNGAADLLFVLQGQLNLPEGDTLADVESILASEVGQSSLLQWAQKYNPQVVSWITAWEQLPLNIIIVDGIENGGLAEAAIRINQLPSGQK